MRIVSVVGARPQFVKVAVICRAIEAAVEDDYAHCIVHTGQHYDFEMNDIFFKDLEIPVPNHHLAVGSGTHAMQTGQIMERLEPVLIQEHPDWILLYGDTNSTLAGALVSAKLGMRVAHVEAGLRSYNRRMPEEINRIVTDFTSDLLLCPTAAAVENLKREGLASKTVNVGDVMYDAALYYGRLAERRETELSRYSQPSGFALATLHRAENTDDIHRLGRVLRALDHIAKHVCPVVLPLHPRTSKRMKNAGLSLNTVTIIEPISYLEMLLLENRAKFILTDSGGVQKEAYFARTPCITLREETEWVETLENGCNILAGADQEKIIAAAKAVQDAGPWTAIYGDGHAGPAVLQALRNRNLN